MVEAAGIKTAFGFHKLRHTAATHMAASGVPLVVQMMLGHQQVALTANLYGHAIAEGLRRRSTR